MENFDILKVLAAIAELAAKAGAGSASLAGCCQPVESRKLSAVLKKNK